jgi:hypothetical protein
VIEWLTDPAALGRTLARIEAVAARVVTGGSAARAAAAVLSIASGGRRTATPPVRAARAA